MRSARPVRSKKAMRAVSNQRRKTVLLTCWNESISPQATGTTQTMGSGMAAGLRRRFHHPGDAPQPAAHALEGLAELAREDLLGVVVALEEDVLDELRELEDLLAL